MTFIEPGEILVPVHEIAKAIGLTEKRAVAMFCRSNWAHKVPEGAKQGALWYCYESVFAANFPRFYSQWREMRDAGAFRATQRARPGNQFAKKKTQQSQETQERPKAVLTDK